MINILVTGGAGFIGSHTCLALLENDYELYVLDSLINGFHESLVRVQEIYYSKSNKKNKLHFKCVDLKNYVSLEKVIKKYESQGVFFEGVIHFAGLKSVEESIQKPLIYWENNVLGTLNLLNILNLKKCKAFIFSSSATVYGTENNSPISEDFNTKPINPYGETKLTIEKILESIYKSEENLISISNLRYFNPIGAHNSYKIGENPRGIPNNLFPYLCKVASGQINELKIFGNDWSTRDGTCIRDYIHVMDLAEGHIKTLNFLLKKSSIFLKMNLGTGKGTTVLELIKIFEDINDISINYSFVNRRDGDVKEIFANVELAKNTIGWIAKRNVYDMCKDGWNWQLNNPNGYE